VTAVALPELPLETVPEGVSPPDWLEEVAEEDEADDDEAGVEALSVDALAAAVPALVCCASNPSAATAATPPTATDVVMRRRSARARSRSAGVDAGRAVCMRPA
jgi:hypothetical protein